MGRRPNPLVVEFFERGAKLPDSSNRYAHTCKRCGEQFPKGRIDSLTGHLLRKCPRLTDEDRRWVFQQTQLTPERHLATGKEPSGAAPLASSSDGVSTDVSLPSFQQHEQSALDTLAEVSRRHLDYSSYSTTGQGTDEDNARSLSETIAEQALIAELANHAFTSQRNPHLQETIGSTTNTLDASPLVQAATAASQQLELAQAQAAEQSRNDSLVDPQLSEQQPSPKRFDTMEGQESESVMTWTPTSVSLRHQSYSSPNVPSNHPTLGFGLLQKPARSKKRGRFDDVRRKEVSEIRKRGACIRCRMLKKPCSGETPCSTCRSVESARLWKTKCLRTRLADEFALWSVSLYHARARTAVPDAISGLQDTAIRRWADVRILSESSVCMNLNVRIFIDPTTNMEPALNPNSDSQSEGTRTVMIIDEGEATGEKLEGYIDQILGAWIEKERSPFMRATLQEACKLIRAEDMEAAPRSPPDPSSRSPRSCYNLQNQLLKNVIELYILTHLLTSPEEHPFTVHYPASGEGPQQRYGEDLSATHGQSRTSPLPESSQSYTLISTMLRATIELRCSKLSKTILNELERRLLQRQQASRFATFLSAVILLSSVERMSGFYRSFDNNEDMDMHFADQSRSEGGNTSSEPTTLHSEPKNLVHNSSRQEAHQSKSWPLETSPASLWPQGQHFAELLIMLLRMRALPPKTSIQPDGTLAASQDFGLPVLMNGEPVRDQVDEQTRAAAAWLDPLRLDVAKLLEKRDSPLPGRGDGVEAWDMVFVSQLLLPEKMK